MGNIVLSFFLSISGTEGKWEKKEEGEEKESSKNTWEGPPKEGEEEEPKEGRVEGELKDLVNGKEEPKEKDDKEGEGGGGREKEANEDVMFSISLLEVSLSLLVRENWPVENQSKKMEKQM